MESSGRFWVPLDETFFRPRDLLKTNDYANDYDSESVSSKYFLMLALTNLEFFYSIICCFIDLDGLSLVL